MTISPQSSAALDRLIALTQDLLAEMASADDLYPSAPGSGWSGAMETVQRHLALAVEGRAADDAALALRGANLLTTANKGVGDLETSPADRPISEKAFAVTRAAIDAAKHLRSDMSLGF